MKTTREGKLEMRLNPTLRLGGRGGGEGTSLKKKGRKRVKWARRGGEICGINT